MIEARALDLVFQTADGPVHALKDVNLSINRGEFVSFIGPSGCGKTTFLRCIAALEHPTGGSLTVNGLTPDEARELAVRAVKFKKERGRSPSMDAQDPWEKRMAEGATAFMRFKKEGRYE